jgi:DHA2 family multidrug resistance protein-like MFS transporter
MNVNAATSIVEPADGLPNPQRLLALLTIMLGIVIAVLDGTIVNVALPTIATEQHASPNDAIWIVTAYQLAVMVSLLPMAALGESIGFKKVFLGGIAVFGLASLLCAYSPSLLVLTLARILQGVAGAALMSVNGALMRFILPSQMFGRGLSQNAMVVAVSAAAGPTIAGAILSVASWHWLFLINVPLAVIAVGVGRITLPATHTTGASLDKWSALLNAAAFGFLVSGLSSIGTTGTPLWLILAQLAIALVAGIALVRRERQRPAPLFPVDLLRIPAFSLSVIASVCSFMAQFLALVSLPFIFHHAMGFSDIDTGLLMTPWPLATAIIAPLSGYVTDRFNPGKVSGIGSLILVLGFISLALLPEHPSVVDITWRLAVCGFGFGLFQSPNNKVMLTSAPRQRSGGASGMLSTARLLGQSIGAAIAAIMFGLLTSFNLPLMMAVAAAFAAVAMVLSVWR